MVKVVHIDNFEVPREEFKFLSDRALDKMADPFCYVPEHTRGSIIRWIEFGIDPGSFLKALIQNDLKTTFGQADDINVKNVQSIVAWFYNNAPSNCWGSIDNYVDWKVDREEDLEKLRA